MRLKGPLALWCSGARRADKLRKALVVLSDASFDYNVIVFSHLIYT